MPSTVPKMVGRAAGRLPGLRRLPVLRLLAIGEIAMLARHHIELLEPRERRRLIELLRDGRGRPHNLSEKDREELARLVAKAEPRLFAGAAAEKLSPVRLPRRVVNGPRKRKR